VKQTTTYEDESACFKPWLGFARVAGLRGETNDHLRGRVGLL